jgi:hypothetical protein
MILAMTTGDAVFFTILSISIAVWGIWSLWMKTCRTEDWLRIQEAKDARQRQRRERAASAVRGIFRRDGEK